MDNHDDKPDTPAPLPQSPAEQKPQEPMTVPKEDHDHEDFPVGVVVGGEGHELREEDLPKGDDSHNEPAHVVESKPTAESHRAASGDPLMHIVKEPIRVDGRNRRNDDDALEGHFVTVVSGEHKGLFGTFEEVVETGADGYPKTILVTPRTAPNQRVEVAYNQVCPASQARR